MVSRQFKVPEAVALQANRLGLEGDAASEICKMADKAAPFTHEKGNRRFHGWWLRIEKGEVLAIGKIDGTRSEEEKLEAKIRVEAAIALHFRRPKETK
jgi:hypothetical protein